MVIGIVGVGDKSIRTLNAMGNNVAGVRPLCVVPPFPIKGNVNFPDEQVVEPTSPRYSETVAKVLIDNIDEEYSGVVVCVDLTNSRRMRKFQHEVSVYFAENFRNMHPDKMLHVLPIIPDGMYDFYGELKEYIPETCRELQKHADSVILYDTGLWGEEEETDEKYAMYPSLATRLGELYGYASRDAKSLRDVSWVASRGFIGIGYEDAELSKERKLIRKQPVLDTDVSNLFLRATCGQLTAPLDIGSSNRGLVVVRAPPDVVDVEEVQGAVDELVAETGINNVRVGIQEDAECEDVRTVVVLTERGVTFQSEGASGGLDVEEEVQQIDVEGVEEFQN